MIGGHGVPLKVSAGGKKTVKQRTFHTSQGVSVIGDVNVRGDGRCSFILTCSQRFDHFDHTKQRLIFVSGSVNSELFVSFCLTFLHTGLH